jgi:hypothetical protein
MSVHAETVASAPARPLANEFSYSRWSLRDEPLMALWAIVPEALLGTAVGLATGSALLAVFVIGPMIVANWAVMLPIRYTLDAAGIERRCGPLRRRIPWSMIGHCDFRSTGARLFRNPHPAPFDVLGCVFVPWGPHRDVVVGHFRRRLSAVLLPKKAVDDPPAAGADETATAVDGLGRPGD